MLHSKYSFVIFSGNIFLLSAGQPVQIFPKAPANTYRFASFLQCNFCSDESLHPLQIQLFITQLYAVQYILHNAHYVQYIYCTCTLCTATRLGWKTIVTFVKRIFSKHVRKKWGGFWHLIMKIIEKIEKHITRYNSFVKNPLKYNFHYEIIIFWDKN